MVHIPGSRETLPKHWLTNRFNVVFHPQISIRLCQPHAFPFAAQKPLPHTQARHRGLFVLDPPDRCTGSAPGALGGPSAGARMGTESLSWGSGDKELLGGSPSGRDFTRDACFQQVGSAWPGLLIPPKDSEARQSVSRCVCFCFCCWLPQLPPPSPAH